MHRYPRRFVNLGTKERYREIEKAGDSHSLVVMDNGATVDPHVSEGCCDTLVRLGALAEVFNHLPREGFDAGGMYVSEKATDRIAAYEAELRRQVNEAWMRLDYKTADRIAALIGDPLPTEHEAAG
jgi:hypothetical protein